MNTLLQEIAQLEGELQAVTDRNEHVRITNLLGEKRDQLSKMQQQVDHEERVTTAVSQFDQLIEKLDFGGLSLREVIGGVSEYMLVTIELKKVFEAQASNFSQQIGELQAKYSEQENAAQERENQLQRQNENLQANVRKLQVDNEESSRLLNQEKMERANAEQTRDNAMTQLDEQKKENGVLKSQIDELNKKIAAGTTTQIQMVDTEEQERQKKEYADKIRRERTVYNRVWVDDIRKDRFKAYLAATGEEIQYPWTEQSKYFVIDESEVQQFRQQYAIEQQTVEQDQGVDQEPIQSSNVKGEQFQLEAPSIQTLATGLDSGTTGYVRESGEEKGETVTRAEFEELKSRVAQLEVGKGAVA